MIATIDRRLKTAIAAIQRSVKVGLIQAKLRLKLAFLFLLRALLYTVALPLARWLIAYLGVEDEILSPFYFPDNHRDEEGHHER